MKRIMEKNNYYVELDFKFEGKTKDKIADFIETVNNIAKQTGSKDNRVQVKENPIYDNFGHLWE